MTTHTPPITLEELLRLTEEVPVMLACYDVRTRRCLYANERFAQIGKMDAASAVGSDIVDIIGSEATQEASPAIERAVRECTTVTYSRSLTLPDGQQRWLEVSLIPWRKADVERLFVMITDTTQRRVADLTRRESNDRLSKFMAASIEGIAFHMGGIITDVNPPLLRLLGYDTDEMTGRRTVDFVPTAEHERVKQVMASGAEIGYHSYALHRDGSSIPVEYIVRDMEWAGQRQRMIVVRDLRESRAAQERIRFLALHDALTGLPNRVQLDGRLDELIARCTASGESFAVLFLDLDQLKRVNDSLGHAFGDQVLIAAADNLSRFCASFSLTANDAWLARLGGDEFVVTCRAENGAHRAFVERVRQVVAIPTRVGTREFRMTASIGVAVFPEDGATPSQLLKNADSAMYQAKTAGRDAVRFFDQSLAQAADQALMIEEALEHGLAGEQFELFYQPELSADGREIVCVEALLRWHHPQRGLLRPDDFIQIAEGLHLIVPIGQWVLGTALAQLARWRAAGLPIPRIAVNLSSNQLRLSDFVDHVFEALQRHGLDGACLELELTERMLMADDGNLRVALERLRAKGISLAVDDFGTGYSSLSRLRTLPLETLKIDQSFVRELPDSASSVAIVNAIIDLARGLSLTAVAEGVETPEQRRCLESLGCRVMQGYLFAEPMPVAEFTAWTRALLGR